MNTIKFQASLGIIPGYDHNNESANFRKDVSMAHSMGNYDYNPNVPARTPTEIVGLVWQEEAKKQFDITGIYAGANIWEGKTVYHTEWGCPNGGEVTVQISGEANPRFIENMDLFKNVVLTVLENCAQILGQTTTQITFTTGEFHYIETNK